MKKKSMNGAPEASSLPPPVDTARGGFDPDHVALQSFADVLRHAGFDVVLASSGPEGIRLVREHVIDLLLACCRLADPGGLDMLKELRREGVDVPLLILTDLVMPEQEGIETIRQLSREHPKLKIIAVSGAFGGQYLKTAGYIGACATLSKPVSPETLLSAIRKETRKAAQA